MPTARRVRVASGLTLTMPRYYSGDYRAIDTATRVAAHAFPLQHVTAASQGPLIRNIPHVDGSTQKSNS
jgi:hypothetical protein